MHSFLTCWSFSIFWLVLALFYLGLAIATYVSSRPIKKNLALLAEKGINPAVKMKDGTFIGLNENLYRAYKTIIITEIIGFILAFVAAGISVFYVN